MNFFNRQQNEPKPKKKLSPLMGIVAGALLCVEFVAMLKFFDAAHAPILAALAFAAVVVAFCFVRDLSFEFAAKIINKINHLFFSWLFRSTSRAFSVDLSALLILNEYNRNKSLLLSCDTRKKKMHFMLHPGAALRAFTLAPSFPRIVLSAA